MDDAAAPDQHEPHVPLLEVFDLVVVQNVLSVKADGALRASVGLRYDEVGACWSGPTKAS